MCPFFRTLRGGVLSGILHRNIFASCTRLDLFFLLMGCLPFFLIPSSHLWAKTVMCRYYERNNSTSNLLCTMHFLKKISTFIILRFPAPHLQSTSPEVAAVASTSEVGRLRSTELTRLCSGSLCAYTQASCHTTYR